MLQALRDAYKLSRFMFWAAVVACDDLFFRGRRQFRWREQLPRLVAAPSADVKRGCAVVTGANSGIGLETAKLLARSGVDVVLACRSRQRGEAALADVQKECTGGARATLMICDVADLRSVAAFAKEVEDKKLAVSVLVNNAGVMVCPWEATPQGYDVQFGTHHLGHALLTQLLVHQQARSGTPLRVVYVGSAIAWGGRWSRAMFHRGDSAPAGFDRYQQYSDVKTVQLLYAYELADRLRAAKRSVTVNALHPGCPSTPVIRHMPLARLWSILLLASPFQITALEAACYVLQMCTSPALDGATGVYHHTNGPLKTDAVTYDAAARAECWEETQKALAPFLSEEQRRAFAP